MIEKSNFFERIMQIIDYYNIKSINSFAKNYLNYDSSEKINRLKRDNTNPSYEILKDISNKFVDLNMNWLITGKGNMLINDNYSKPLPIATKTDSKTGIPLIPIDAMAGWGKGDNTVMEYECERYVIPMFRDAEFLIRISGTSMIPKFRSGDIVACKKLPLTDLFFQWNKIYVLDTNQGALIKRIKPGSDKQHITCISENKDYDPFELSQEQIHSIALVIGIIRLE